MESICSLKIQAGLMLIPELIRCKYVKFSAVGVEDCAYTASGKDKL